MRKTLVEDVTQAGLVVRQLTPATLEEEPMEEPAQAMSWESLMEQTFNKVVNIFPYIALMWRSMSTSQTILINS